MLKITFNTNYHTNWGKQIIVIGNIPELGLNDLRKGLKLSYLENGNWSKTIDIEAAEFEYQYVLVNDKFQELDKEAGQPRVFSHSTYKEEN